MPPFTWLATREDGSIQVCCRSHPIGFIQYNTLEEIWNNENMCRIRNQGLTNESPKECEPCFNLGDQGVESLHQRQIDGIINYIQATDQNLRWDDCVKFNHKLDAQRNRSVFEQVTPEFAPYV